MACCIAAAYLWGLLLRGLAALGVGPLARAHSELAWPPPARWSAPGEPMDPSAPIGRAVDEVSEVEHV